MSCMDTEKSTNHTASIHRLAQVFFFLASMLNHVFCVQWIKETSRFQKFAVWSTLIQVAMHVLV